ncbi:DUF6057 family protein [uncultured Parabacteroides sp.]|uniref:DUF6057 family protein n=1 Tax=uncultured Parabacteroides sp. TaxID=512312 RepID=UPI00261509B0|nr:DUF6057 family protein [uncultured Parabacteroides sp.]
MRYKQILPGLILFALLGVFLQITSKFHFFYIEQLQLFQFSGDYLADKICDPGGLSLIVGEFLTQFFITPYAGPFIVGAVLTCIGLTTRAIIRQIIPDKELFLLYLLPVLSLLLIQYDFNYLLQGTIAFLFCLLSLNIWIRIKDFRYRLPAALVITPSLFWIGGPVAGLFSLSVVIWELSSRSKHGIYSLTVLIEYILIGIGSVWTTTITSYRFAFLPDVFYHPILAAPNVIYFAWISLPFCLIAAFLYPKNKNISKKKTGIELTAQAIIILSLCWMGIPRYNDQKSYPLKVLDYYARTGQWDEIIQYCQGPIKNYLYLTYLNRALAEKGELADRMFAFDQHGPQGLLASWNKTFTVSNLLSDAYFTLGEIALSQEMAFEGYVTVIGAGNPRNLQRLIQTNLIYGTYPIAEKYISILEKTYAYRDWAKQHRDFLYNDKAIEADPVLGPKRKGLPKDSNLSGINGLEYDLLIRAEQDPDNQLPIQFTGAIYLLSKDMKSFQALIEKYYGTPILPSLPISFQEAVILLAEKDVDYWKRFNISKNVIRKFAGYRNLVVQNRNNPQLPQLIKNSFGDTYWSYYILK